MPRAREFRRRGLVALPVERVGQPAQRRRVGWRQEQCLRNAIRCGNRVARTKGDGAEVDEDAGIGRGDLQRRFERSARTIVPAKRRIRAPQQVSHGRGGPIQGGELFTLLDDVLVLSTQVIQPRLAVHEYRAIDTGSLDELGETLEPFLVACVGIHRRELLQRPAIGRDSQHGVARGDDGFVGATEHRTHERQFHERGHRGRIRWRRVRKDPACVP